MTVRKSLVISFGEKYSVMAIQFFSSLILARLLTPEEIGIFSVGTLFVGFAHMLREFGISNYIIQEKELTTARLRTAFCVTLLFAWIAAALLFIISDTISEFYNEPGLTTIINILSISFLFIPFSSTIFGMLRREMNFSKIYWINITSTIINCYTSIILALYGYGYFSLAWAALAGGLTTTALTIILRPQNAQFIPSFTEFKHILSFGTKSSLTSLAIEFGNNTPELIIGRIISFEAVGYFSKATGLANLFNKLITSATHSVAIPYFAQIHRNNGNINKSFIYALELLLGTAWIFYLFLAFFSQEIILLLFGSQWGSSAPLAKILCIGFAVKIIPAIASWLLTAIGSIDKNMKARILWESILVSLIIPSAFYSLELICYAVLLGNIIGTIIYWFTLKSEANIRTKDFTRAISMNITMILLTYITLEVLTALTKFYKLSELYIILIPSIFSTLYWLSLAISINHPIRKEIINLKNNFKNNYQN